MVEHVAFQTDGLASGQRLLPVDGVVALSVAETAGEAHGKKHPDWLGVKNIPSTIKS